MLQVSPPDSGFYSCVAGNILGESVSSAYLEISPAPRPAPAPALLLLLGLSLLASHILVTLPRAPRTPSRAQL